MPNHRPSVWLDHFVVAIKDLDEGMRTFATMTGVHPVKGGEHPTFGTHNALVSLGERQYFEILAPRPGAILSPVFEGADKCDELTPLRWAVATDNIRALHNIIASAGYGVNDVVPGSRLTTGGETLRWNMFTPNDSRLASAPFFIEWDTTSHHPSMTTPTGCVLESFLIVTPNSTVIETFFAAIDYNVHVMDGPKGMQIILDTPEGTVNIGT